MSMSQSSQNAALKQQKVVVPNNHGEKLVGILHETGSAEIGVLCHGHRASKEDLSMMNLAVTLQNEGISSFRFDLAGNGESEGTFGYSNYWREADDLRAVVEHFCGENRVIGAILGYSKGGGILLLYASKYHDIHTIINVSGRYDLKGGIEDRLGKDYMEKIKQDGLIDVKNKTDKNVFCFQHTCGFSGQSVDVNYDDWIRDFAYRVTEESLMDRLNTNMHEACLQIDKACRVLTIHGSADKIIPVQDAREFDKIIPKHKLHIVKGANHGCTKHQAQLASAVLEFIKAGLKQDQNTLTIPEPDGTYQQHSKKC